METKAEINRDPRWAERLLPEHVAPARARMSSRRKDRRGATVVELAIVLLVFLTMVFGMLDLGIGIFRHHNLSQAARQGARQAIVHGQLADKLGSWGPTKFSSKGNIPSPIVNEISPSLVTLDLSKVDIEVEWLDNGNNGMIGDQVRVVVTAPYQPMMTFIFGNPTITLRGESTMAIAH